MSPNQANSEPNILDPLGRVELEKLQEIRNRLKEKASEERNVRNKKRNKSYVYTIGQSVQIKKLNPGKTERRWSKPKVIFDSKAGDNVFLVGNSKKRE